MFYEDYVPRPRLIALNGKFDTGLESELRDFLEKVARVPFRSENSSEYVSLLWGHYHQQLMDEKRRSEAIMSQVEAGFETVLFTTVAALLQGDAGEERALS